MKDIAVFFDMDGVLVDSFPFHVEAWKIFCLQYGIVMTEERLKHDFFGKTNEEIFPVIFSKEFSSQELKKLADEKEALYRQVYKGKVSLLPGLHQFLQDLKRNNIPVAIGTAAPAENAFFVVNETNSLSYFDKIVDASFVTKGKPDPEIYLKCAKQLNVSTSRAVVFEDSFMGIDAAKGAGTKIVGVATTHTKEVLAQRGDCHLIIEDFVDLSVQDIYQLF